MDRNTVNQAKRSRIISHIPQKKPYTAFSGVYDRVMRGAAYRLWAQVALSAYSTATGNSVPSKILDLGCGTCALWKLLPSRSEIWGIDASREMLSVAEKRRIPGNRVQANLLSLPPLPAPFDLILSVHDTFNYFLDEGQLRKIFREISGLLGKAGIFFFDVSTERNFEKNFDGAILEETHDGIHLIWENEYSKKDMILTTRLKFQEKGTEIEEVHLHKAYPTDVWRFLLESSGLEILKIGSDYSSWKISPKAEYLNFVCRTA
ncbi:methyltransferase domain protein [Leptospira broomii serovar Hurstbridge str. 5399]|uniref:Methyltransferase domain protein n=1 Tax=Leptospira broomii serovar Hurstbridge str. 5399 TaxID=1049789 RepID=T0FH63_9LEPT|nr:class I SAM-dependent methyltransferase [Leptospira broomii]EQA46952.1 methyltransferase domain protein [Leptospira broomii serovar Hurstbridge str. 5399]